MSKWFKDNLLGIAGAIGTLLVVAFQSGQVKQDVEYLRGRTHALEAKIETKVEDKIDRLGDTLSSVSTKQEVMAQQVNNISAWINRQESKATTVVHRP